MCCPDRSHGGCAFGGRRALVLVLAPDGNRSRRVRARRESWHRALRVVTNGTRHSSNCSGGCLGDPGLAIQLGRHHLGAQRCSRGGLGCIDNPPEDDVTYIADLLDDHLFVAVDSDRDHDEEEDTEGALVVSFDDSVGAVEEAHIEFLDFLPRIYGVAAVEWQDREWGYVWTSLPPEELRAWIEHWWHSALRRHPPPVPGPRRRHTHLDKAFLRRWTAEHSLKVERVTRSAARVPNLETLPDLAPWVVRIAGSWRESGGASGSPWANGVRYASRSHAATAIITPWLWEFVDGVASYLAEAISASIPENWAWRFSDNGQSIALVWSSTFEVMAVDFAIALAATALESQDVARIRSGLATFAEDLRSTGC